MPSGKPQHARIRRSLTYEVAKSSSLAVDEWACHEDLVAGGQTASVVGTTGNLACLRFCHCNLSALVVRFARTPASQACSPALVRATQHGGSSSCRRYIAIFKVSDSVGLSLQAPVVLDTGTFEAEYLNMHVPRSVHASPANVTTPESQCDRTLARRVLTDKDARLCVV